MLRFYISAIVFCLLMAPVTANAAKISDEGAKRLETLFSKVLEDQKQAMEVSETSLVTKGKITVEQAKDYYAVTLPEITITNPEGDETHIGFIAINATPTDNPNNWKMSVAIPTPILRKNAEGETETEISIGSQRMVGLWLGEMENFSQLKANYKDIVAKTFPKNNRFNIADMTILVDLKETKDGLWSGPSKITFSDVSVDTPEEENALTLKEAILLASITDIDPLKYKEATKELSNLEIDNTKSQQSIGIINTLLKASGDAVTVKGSLSDLKMKTKAKEHKPAREINLEKVAFDYGIDGLQGDNVNLTVGLNYRGDTKKEETEKALMPHTADARITLNNFPMTKVISIGQSTLPNDDSNPDAQKVAALQAMMTLPQLLAESGTTLEIKDIKYGNNTYFVNLDGTLKANRNSMLGASGEMLLKVMGMEKLRTALQAESSEEDTKEQRMIDQALKRIEFIEKISKKEGNVHVSKLVLGEDGKITINGQDAKTVMRGETTQPVENIKEPKKDEEPVTSE
jgi:hypothetical protein